MTPNERQVERYVLALAALAGLVTALAYGIVVQPDVTWDGGSLALLGLFTVGYFFLQRRGFILHWRGQRVVSTIDEPMVYLSLVLLPFPACIIVIFAGTCIVQAVARRKHVKALYNISAYALAAGVASLVYLVGLAAGLPTYVAGLPAVAFYTLTSNMLVAGVFAILEGEPVLRVFRTRFLVSTPLHGVLGGTFGFAAVALWGFHPLATLVLAPMSLLALGFARLDASNEREIRVRRRLAQMDADLVGAASEERVADLVLAACQDMFIAGRAVVTLVGDESPPRAWTREYEGGAGSGRAIESSIVGRSGRSLGHIAVWPSGRVRELLGAAERPLLDIVASRTGTAIESAKAMRELVELKDLHEEIVHGVPAGVIRLDAQGRILQANAYLLRALGEADAPAPRTSVFDWPPMQRVPEFFTAVRKLLEGEAFYDFELHLQDDRGTTLDASGVPLEDGGIVLLSDVTTHRQAEEAMKSQTLTRPFVRRLVLSLVSGLNVPRAAISGVGRSLAREVGLTDVREYAGAFRAMGLGNLQFDRVDGDKYFFSADDLLEKRAGSSQPTCHLALGFLEGAVAAAHKGTSLGTELRCQSQGHSRCVFVVQPRHEADVHERVPVRKSHLIRP